MQNLGIYDICKDGLNELGIDYYLVYPKRELKEETNIISESVKNAAKGVSRVATRDQGSAFGNRKPLKRLERNF